MIYDVAILTFVTQPGWNFRFFGKLLQKTQVSYNFIYYLRSIVYTLYFC